MILVNGEDLTYFRKVSSLIFKLVRAIVWEGKVEKLGMDELFCDVRGKAWVIELDDSCNLDPDPSRFHR